jgi:hypothetical protein
MGWGMGCRDWRKSGKKIDLEAEDSPSRLQMQTQTHPITEDIDEGTLANRRRDYVWTFTSSSFGPAIQQHADIDPGRYSTLKRHSPAFIAFDSCHLGISFLGGNGQRHQRLSLSRVPQPVANRLVIHPGLSMRSTCCR